ncbi:uncharacterized protein BYT42DRAFT_610908 [Radiomyces spectabilis]|uniref:uncharacterized protein n=1 Tax=Radiomyces spectabilis TaxID=64574 RepID=UPI00221E4F28|nr:uncharacterized protein BYT42DRAFT_610908 [Radiomyces spectabilis]KAI8391711.1 hypothetical protein BYT42DRAFT_610908 [Radiomyces spectabilis]
MLADQQDSLASELTCAVCQDLYKEPVSFIPCLHTFCSQCSRNLKDSIYDVLTCPICREEVQYSRKNFMIENILALYKKMEPRTTSSSVKTAKEDSDWEVIATCTNGIASMSTTEDTNPHIHDCTRAGSPSPSIDFDHSDTTTSAATNTDNYISNTIRCVGCAAYMCVNHDTGRVALNQICHLCGVVSCNLTSECPDPSPQNKLYSLKNLTKDEIPQFLREVDCIEAPEEGHLNSSEIGYLEIYLAMHDITWQDSWQVCLDNYDTQAYVCTAATRMIPWVKSVFDTFVVRQPNAMEIINADSSLRYTNVSDYLTACYTCTATFVNGQYFGFWRSVLPSDLPSFINEREYCRWGKECATQWNIESHAERLNHLHEKQ